MALVGAVGLGLIIASALTHSAIETRGTQEILNRLARMWLDFNVAQSDSIRAELNFWRTHLDTESSRHIAARDIGIAMMVAGILTFVIEMYARSRLQDEIRSGVIEAAFRRLIPPAIFDDVKLYVFGARVLKRDWEIEMLLLKSPRLSAQYPDLYVSRTVISYQLHNLTGSHIVEPLHIHLDEDVVGVDESGPLPRFESIRIGLDTYTDGELKGKLQRNGALFEDKVDLAPGYLQLVICLWEIVRVPDTFVWSTTKATEGARIVIESVGVPEIAFEVRALHPDPNRLLEHVPGRTWVFTGGMLPWQGFQVRSWKSAPQDEHGTPNRGA
jgi:hypothetical protein